MDGGAAGTGARDTAQGAASDNLKNAFEARAAGAEKEATNWWSRCRKLQAEADRKEQEIRRLQADVQNANARAYAKPSYPPSQPAAPAGESWAAERAAFEDQQQRHKAELAAGLKAAEDRAAKLAEAFSDTLGAELRARLTAPDDTDQAPQNSDARNAREDLRRRAAALHTKAAGLDAREKAVERAKVEWRDTIGKERAERAEDALAKGVVAAAQSRAAELEAETAAQKGELKGAKDAATAASLFTLFLLLGPAAPAAPRAPRASGRQAHSRS